MTTRKDTAKPLSANEKRFCAIYVANGRNGTDAYSQVFPRVARNSANTRASTWLRRHEIQAEVDRLTVEILKREHMTADEALAQMARIARADIGDLFWKPGELDSAGNPTVPRELKPLFEMPKAIRVCIKSFKFDENGNPEFTFWNKDAQLTNIGKHHKLLNESLDVNVQLGFADKLRRAREKRMGAGAKK